MLFIDDDQSQISKGQEQGRSRANDNRCITAQRKAPQLALFARTNIRMPFLRHNPEPFGESCLPGGRQGNFRKQYQYLAAGIQHALDRIEIHLGLARSGDTIQQKGHEAPFKRFRNGGGSNLLVIRQGRPLQPAWTGRGLITCHKDRFEATSAFHAANHAGADTRLALQ